MGYKLMVVDPEIAPVNAVLWKVIYGPFPNLIPRFLS